MPEPRVGDEADAAALSALIAGALFGALHEFTRAVLAQPVEIREPVGRMAGDATAWTVGLTMKSGINVEVTVKAEPAQEVGAT